MPTGSETIAASLQALGVQHVFGIVGIPIIDVAEACIAVGIRFISFRNEQSAAYAASIYGYLTGKPGVALVVGGPGVVHALSGVENANANRFPMLLLAGSSETTQRGMGAFQQLDQISLLRAAGAKFSEQPNDLMHTPQLIRQAYISCQYGKPGPAYIDLPANLIMSDIPAIELNKLLINVTPVIPPPKCAADPYLVHAAVLALKEAKFPLLIVGKGCASSASAVRLLQHHTNLSFIPTPMGKGVLSDALPQNLSAARSLSLKTADVVLVLGARLNWILHFGSGTKYNPLVKFFQCVYVGEDVAPLSNNVGLIGDVGRVAEQLLNELHGWKSPEPPEAIITKRKLNEERAFKKEAAVTSNNFSGLLTYEPVYAIIRSILETHFSHRRIIYVSEGANTMDVSRSSFPLSDPKCRLDAGTNATMGVGLGYAIAAKLVYESSMVIALEGDSAFGFSAMEIETAVRNELPMIIYVMNNSGVYHGSDPALYTSAQKHLPSTALSLQTKYHDLAISLGAIGYEARSLDQVEEATLDAIHSNKVAVINVILDPAKDKELKFAWMSKM